MREREREREICKNCRVTQKSTLTHAVPQKAHQYADTLPTGECSSAVRFGMIVYNIYSGVYIYILENYICSYIYIIFIIIYALVGVDLLSFAFLHVHNA